jgi:hypothetical protein
VHALAQRGLARASVTEFSKASVPLVTGGSRTFNAVAADRSVVATVMNSSEPTSGGKKALPGDLAVAVAQITKPPATR